jgi:hypothetical protein
MVRIVFLALLLAPAAERPVCNIPVFRYALERWPAAPFEVLAVHRGPLTEDQSAALNALRASGANVDIDRIDLAEPVPPRVLKILERVKADPPCLLALYPATETEAWRGPWTAEAARSLADSPVRRDLSRRLLEGQSGVWVLLESGDKAADDAATALLSKELRGLDQSLKLPAHHPDDPPLLSDVPVKVGFSMVRLSRRDPAEQALVSMLLRSESGLNGPAVFPVFGRGRALWALSGAGINAANIAEAGMFLTGPCSCEAKELNPGVDLLFATDWEAGFSSAPLRERIPDPVLKPRPAETPAPGSSPSSSSPALWIALLAVGLLVAVSGRRVLAASKDKTS